MLPEWKFNVRKLPLPFNYSKYSRVHWGNCNVLNDYFLSVSTEKNNRSRKKGKYDEIVNCTKPGETGRLWIDRYYKKDRDNRLEIMCQHCYFHIPTCPKCSVIACGGCAPVNQSWNITQPQNKTPWEKMSTCLLTETQKLGEHSTPRCRTLITLCC